MDNYLINLSDLYSVQRPDQQYRGCKVAPSVDLVALPVGVHI